MPDNGTYLLSNVGFSSNGEPLLLLQDSNAFIVLHPVGNTFTINFDMSQRYCIGWRDITSGERFVCPDSHVVDQKYEQCAACQKRTGFNPAFYHAANVSEQQEARNQEPHILYLAHFGSGIVKVGISHAKRGNSRLLEQGARTALILDTFPSAHIARQYEAQIATIPGIVETLQQRKKSDLLTKPYDTEAAIKELLAAKQTAEQQTGALFTGGECLKLDSVYFPHTIPPLSEAYDTSNDNMISGEAIGMLGTLLFCQQGESLFYLPLKKHIGYKGTISTTTMPIATPARQTSLF